MPKRSAADGHLAAVVPAPKVDGAMKSRSGRTVKPKVWNDGTLAAPLAALKEDVGELSPGVGEHVAAAASDAADPDFLLHAEQQHAHSDSQGRGSGGPRGSGDAAPHHLDTEDEEAYSDGSPRVSADDGSQGGGSMGRARSGSVGRDEHGKFMSGPRPRSSRGGGGGSRSTRSEGGGGIFKMAAVEVLRLEKRLMSTGEIARVALKRGLIKCTGKTPEATMASALYTDIKRKEGQSIFIRPHEGLFGLREWIDHGVTFQDEFAEEMAKRARAAFGAFVGMPGMPPLMPPMVDSEGVPISTPYPPMMPFPGMPSMPGMALPMPMGPPPAAAAAAAAKASCGDDSPDGLMELLSAAEELHKSSSKDANKADVKYVANGTATPAAIAPSPAAAVVSAAGAQAANAAGAAGPAPMDIDQSGGSEGPGATAPVASQQAASRAEGGAGQKATTHAPMIGGAGSHRRSQRAADTEVAVEASAEEDDAAAMLAAVAGAAAEEPTSCRSPADSEAAAAVALQAFPSFVLPDGAAAAVGGPYAGMQYHPPYGYPPYGYYPPYMYPPAVGLPPLPKAQRKAGLGAAATAFAEADAAAAAAATAVAELAAVSSGSIDLTVRGSNRPFAAVTAGSAAAAAATMAAAMEAEGQEQVNILNLPLPEVGPQAARNDAGASGPHTELEPAQLKDAEVQVMRLEKELGTSHPEVGKAYLSLSRLYLAGCEESSSKQLAVAALSRSWEILNVCQLALKRQPSCTTSFTYLMDKIRSAELQRPAAAGASPGAAAATAAVAPTATAAAAATAAAVLAEQRLVGEVVANGDAAHVTLQPSPAPMHMAPLAAAAH